MIKPVEIGATRVATKGLKKISEAIPGKIFNRLTTKDSHT
jgi:hypothetical protein